MGTKKNDKLQPKPAKTAETVVDTATQGNSDTQKQVEDTTPATEPPETIVDKELQPVLPVENTNTETETTEKILETAETLIDSEEQPKVKTLSGKFHKHEMEYIDKVLEARQTTVNKGKPLTRDVNHFIRQCVKFAINHRPNAKFWLPDIAETIIDI